MQTEAVFFNGVNSKPIDVTVKLQPALRQILLLVPEDGIMAVPFSDLTITHRDRELLLLSYGSPRRIIEIRNPDFARVFLSSQKSTATSRYHQLLNTGWKGSVVFAAVIIAFAAAVYFFAIPFIAEQSVILLPKSFDKKIGEKTFDQLTAVETIDTSASRLLRNYYHLFNPENDHHYTLVVLKKNELNAFALPDGHIVVYSGILQKINKQSELAGLLAHETAHVTHRHSMKILCRSIAGFLVVSLLLNDVNGIMASIAQNANSLQNLSYSRGFEKEADISGFELLRSRRIDPHGMISLFEVLKRQEKTTLPGFLSTHPVTQDRIDYLNTKIKEDPYSFENNLQLENAFSMLKQKVNTLP